MKIPLTVATSDVPMATSGDNLGHLADISRQPRKTRRGRFGDVGEGIMLHQKPFFPSALPARGMRPQEMEAIPKVGMGIAWNLDVTKPRKGGMPRPDKLCHKPKGKFLLREEKLRKEEMR